MRDAGNRVIYFAGYKKGEDLFKREEIEAATDQVIWSTDTGAAIAPGRPQDAHFRGNIVQAMLAYQHGELGERARAARHGRSDHRDRIGPHDGGGEGGAARRAGAVPQAGPRRHRQHQLADAVHDEGSLRAVPAEARRSGRPARRRSSSRASTRIRRWTASTFRISPRGCGRTRCRRSCRICGSIICWQPSSFRTSDGQGGTMLIALVAAASLVIPAATAAVAALPRRAARGERRRDRDPMAASC